MIYVYYYISLDLRNNRRKQQGDFGISRGFYFHETSHMQSFVKIKPLRKFPNLL